MTIVQYSEDELQRRLAQLEHEPSAWVRENARGMLLGTQCCGCCATIVTGEPAPRKRVLCASCTSRTLHPSKEA